MFEIYTKDFKYQIKIKSIFKLLRSSSSTTCFTFSSLLSFLPTLTQDLKCPIFLLAL